MTLKVKAWENSREKFITLTDIVSAVKNRREVFECSTIVNSTVTLTYEPLTNTDMVILNGQILTDGVNYDYTVSGYDIVFNNGVLTTVGHVKVDYRSL